MGITEEGIEGEKWILKYFISHNVECFQPDTISFENGAYVLNEVKHQNFYESPPFDGHGLPLWQVKARMRFYKKTKIRCRLIVREKGTNIIYTQWIDILEGGEFYDTKGMSPRRIYNLKSFNKHIEGELFHDFDPRFFIKK